MTTFNPIRRLFNTNQLIPPGVYHYQSPPDDPRNYRLHLRVEPDGNGVLIVNAATVLHLNQTAAEYAYYLIQSLPPDKVAREVSRRYNVTADQARQDYLDLTERIQILVSTTDLDPVTFLDFDRQTPYSGRISAPYRLDCAITYRLPKDATPEAAPTDRVKRELSAAEWQSILDKAWSVGIPHIVFTGGEPTLRDDLSTLIRRAEANGQVTGLLTDGLRLADKAYLDTLLQTGLDHLMIIDPQENTPAWSGLQNALDADIFVAVHITLTPAKVQNRSAFLTRLAEMGVKAISLSISDPNLKNDLLAAHDQVNHLGLELVWNLPVPYSSMHPVALEVETAEYDGGSGRAWMYVEPDGDVLPSQGINKVMGNLLNDAWEKIWKMG